MYPTTGKPRGQPATALPAEAFVYCLQNHDQIGNRALGDRLTGGGAKADTKSVMRVMRPCRRCCCFYP